MPPLTPDLPFAQLVIKIQVYNLSRDKGGVMPKVPEFNLKPLKSMYYPGTGQATMKQKELILRLCGERKIPPPQIKDLTAEQASLMIDKIINYR